MSVAAAGGAVSTHPHQPTQEQIRLARLIEDKKHDHPEVQEILRKVLDIVTDSNQDDALLALFDCDYDCERTVALLIEKGHEVASEWRTATNHKPTKKQQQQQQKVVTTKNGHGNVDENGHQRGNGHTSRGKSRRFQQNGSESQNGNNQASNENSHSQSRPRGGSGYRGRNRGYNRSNFRGTDRTHQQQAQQTNDAMLDGFPPSDANNRRNRNTADPLSQVQDQFDVGNWNGETLIYSRTTKDEEIPPPPSASTDDATNVGNNQTKSTSEFDPIEAARQIKSVIGIGQTAKASNSDQQQQQQKAKSTTKVTPPPPPSSQTRIPQQPVIFSDRFDGRMNKIDVQFGNLDDSSSAFYSQSESIPTNKLTQRTTEQSAHISPSIRSSDQPVNNQHQQTLTNQIHHQQQQQQQQQHQQPSIPIKPIVTPQYAVHQQQHQMNPSNVLLQSLLYHPQQAQPEPVAFDTSSYDPTAFSLPSMDFNSAYFMPGPTPQPTPARYLVTQPHPPPQPQGTSSKPAQTPSGSVSTTTTGAKKAPTVPPGMFPPNTVPSMAQQAAYSTTYGVQQQASGAGYSTGYDTEPLFANPFMPLSNAQQAQSPTGTYGSVTPPNQQQQGNNTNDSKAMHYRPPLTENLLLLQQYTLQQSNSQQPGTHSQAPLSYFLGHPAGGGSYSPGPQIMYAPPATAMPQQQAPKQQYNQNHSSTGISGNDDYYGRTSSSTTSNKEGQYLYSTATQPQHGQTQSSGQQQQGVSKGQQQQQQQQPQSRPSGNVYNNHQGQQRPF